MAIYKEDIVDIELESGTIHRSFLCHAIGLGDNQGNRFGVRLFRNGAAENVGSASVTGLFMAPNGTNYIISGSGNVWASGNVAGVILPSGCYAVEGQFTLAIKLSLSGVVTTMRIIDGVVSNTGTTGAVVPSSNVPTSDQIIAAYQQAVAVIDSSVRYDVAQTKTAAQKTQARTNIEAAGLAQVVRVDADQSLTSTQKGKARTNIEAAGLAQVVRVDEDQSLTSTQKGKARTNIEAAGLAQVVRVDADQSLTDAQKAKARTNIEAASTGEVSDLKTAIGNTALPTTAQTITGAIAEHESDIISIRNGITSETIRATSAENLKVNKPTSSPNGVSGQLLRTNGDGTTVWADQGLPTDEQTEDAVASWLDDHPEATTTVQDHSLTNKKMVIGTMGYVTPEMYGAIGNGIADDTEAVRNALTQGVMCLISNKYLVSKQINIVKDVYITGGGSIVASDDFDDDYIINITLTDVPEGHHETVLTGIDNITIDCNKRCGGIYLNNTRKGVFSSIKVKNIETYGIYQTDGYENIFSGVFFTSYVGGNGIGLSIQSDELVESVFSVNCKNCLDLRGGANRILFIHGWNLKDVEDWASWLAGCAVIKISSYYSGARNYIDFVYSDTYPTTVDYESYSYAKIDKVLFNKVYTDAIRPYLIQSFTNEYKPYYERVEFNKIYEETTTPVSPSGIGNVIQYNERTKEISGTGYKIFITEKGRIVNINGWFDGDGTNGVLVTGLPVPTNQTMVVFQATLTGDNWNKPTGKCYIDRYGGMFKSWEYEIGKRYIFNITYAKNV